MLKKTADLVEEGTPYCAEKEKKMIRMMIFQCSFQLQHTGLLLCNRPGSQQGEVS